VSRIETAEGLLLADKPAGPTSHDVVSRIRGILGVRRAGHAGTLDPFARGLLLVLLGRATRLAEDLSALDKTYLATLHLGASSSTGDPEGEIAEVVPPPPPPSEADLQGVLEGFSGEHEQVPPAHSAVHVAGERAYRMARGGVAFTLSPRRVRIARLEILDDAYPLLRLRLVTSSGFYVRSFARDVGEALGSAAYVAELRREAIGTFHLARAVVPRRSTREELAAQVLAPEAAVAHLPSVSLDEIEGRALAQGRRLPLPAVCTNAGLDGAVRLEVPGGFLGVGAVEGEGLRGLKILYPERVLP
jgi:tRNA pseudouridine55 synthase